MSGFRHRAHGKRCLYPYNSGFIQLNVECLEQNSNSKTSWAALTDPFTGNGENAQHQQPILISSQITCALHPTLSGNGGVFRILNRLRMKLFRYFNDVDIVSAERQFGTSSVVIYCNLPHLYPTTSCRKTSSELDVSWGVYDAIITLLQTHFLYCKHIMLVLWVDRSISLSRAEAEQDRDAMMARLEKVLYRADELYRTLTQQGCDFSIFPSPAAFELCLDRAKETGGIFEEGDWDHNRGAESRVWRSIEENTFKNGLSDDIRTDRKLGYWVRTSFFDWFERKDMQFV